ncbi:hypothetical protein GPECTOR_561g582 [Gonium pectorale]|uniref:Uncharacterized protein n=1 Tax=Gonium pectorale TaxID=33097 RepID=A0A150FUN5_GONPE|nr:hypothetical protein GPECTOR_561g582 [Gonium pectorale]|eukprot:KXZ41312.1 hypothetical protein GPECTOR_561g582 [Gonium pectorale]
MSNINVEHLSACHRNTATRQANVTRIRNDQQLLPMVAEGLPGGAPAGAFPGPDVPFPQWAALVRSMTAEELDTLESFYGVRFGATTNSLEYRRGMFAAFLGDADEYYSRMAGSAIHARQAGVDLKQQPHLA